MDSKGNSGALGTNAEGSGGAGMNVYFFDVFSGRLLVVVIVVLVVGGVIDPPSRIDILINGWSHADLFQNRNSCFDFRGKIRI